MYKENIYKLVHTSFNETSCFFQGSVNTYKYFAKVEFDRRFIKLIMRQFIRLNEGFLINKLSYQHMAVGIDEGCSNSVDEL